MIGFAAITLVIAAILLGGGWWMIDRWAPQWGFMVLLFSVAVNFVAGWMAFAVILAVRKHRPSYVPQAALGATVIRILVVGAALLIAMFGHVWDAMAISVCMLAAYLAFLAAETWVTVRMIWRQSEHDTNGQTNEP